MVRRQFGIPSVIRDAFDREGLLATMVGVSLLLAVGFHLTAWTAGKPHDLFPQAIYGFTVVMGMVCLYRLLSLRYSGRPSNFVRLLWTILMVGAFIALVAALSSLGSRPIRLDALPASSSAAVGFDLETGIPLAVASIFRMNITAIMMALFSLLMLVRLRELVLIKRTVSSQRNWYLMIGFMVVASMSVFMKPARLELNVIQQLALIPATLLMIANSMRLSWIVFLSFKEKLTCILIVTLLLVLLSSMGFLEMPWIGNGILPEGLALLKHYSYPLASFVGLSMAFGFLYFLTTLLSLLFHLPTTSAFQQKAGEVAAMHSLTTLVSQVLDKNQLYDSIVASPVESGLGASAWMALKDPTSGTTDLQIRAVRNMSRSQLEEVIDSDGLFDEIRANGSHILLDHAPGDHRVKARPGDGIGSLLAVPLNTRDDVVGALFVTKEVNSGFEPDDVEAIRAFAAQAALAIDNSRLFEERIEKERLSRELAIAREVQQKLLPQKLPELPGVELSASSWPAQEVGGDYFDVAQIGEDQTGFIIGDVSGKGTSAAFYMAELQGVFRALSRMAETPADFLYNANMALSSTLENNVFISVVYGVLDRKREQICIARAGHCPTAYVSVTGEASYLRTQGMAIGMDTRGQIFRDTLEETTVHLSPGDVVVLFTDGVVESRNSEGDEYGYDRLLSTLKANRHEEAADVHRQLILDLNDFIGEEEYGDDLTVLVIKWTGATLPKV